MLEVDNILRNNKKICNFKSNTELVLRLLVMHLYQFMSNGKRFRKIGGTPIKFRGGTILIKFHKVL